MGVAFEVLDFGLIGGELLFDLFAACVGQARFGEPQMQSIGGELVGSLPLVFGLKEAQVSDA